MKEGRYGEDEVVTEVKQRSEKVSSGPHHTEIGRGHEEGRLGLGGVGVGVGLGLGLGLHVVAVGVHSQAASVGLVVPSDEHHVIEQPVRVVANAKALRKKIEYRTSLQPCIVQSCHYHCLVCHRRSSQNPLQL